MNNEFDSLGERAAVLLSRVLRRRRDANHEGQSG